MTDAEIEMPDRIFATCENHECEWSDERYRHWNHQVEYVRVDLSPPVESQAAEIARLRDALRDAEPFVEICHSLMTTKDARKSVWRVLKQVRAALAAEPTE